MNFKKFGLIMCAVGLLICGAAFFKQSAIRSQQEDLRLDAQIDSLRQSRAAMDAVLNGRRYDRSTPISEQEADALEENISRLNTWLIIGGIIFAFGVAFSVSAGNKANAA